MNTKLTVLNVVQLMLKRWWIILLALMIGGGTFFSYYKYAVAPVYTSSGSLFVNNVREKKTENVNMGDMTTSQMLVWTYVELLGSNTFFTQVAETSGLGYTPGQLARMIKLAPKNDTEIMLVTAVCENPEHAQLLVNTVLEAAPLEIDRIIKGGSTEVVDYAQLPTAPSGPRIMFNTFIGAVLFAALAAGLILLVEILDNRVKDEDDLTQSYEYPVLGTIPDIG